jgi:hypothetical protein
MLLYSHEKIREMCHRLNLHFPKARILNVTDLPWLWVDTTVIQMILVNSMSSLEKFATRQGGCNPQFEKPWDKEI